VLKLDTAGNVIWEKDFGHPDLQDLRPFGLIEAKDSCYIITGGYATANTGIINHLYNGWLLKIDRNGNEVWSKNNYGYTSGDTYISVIKENSNNDLISIFNNSLFEIIQCLNPTGEIKWFRPYYFNGDEYADMSVLNTFDFTNDGGYIFAGYGTDYDSVPATRSWVIKTDSLGFDGTYYNGDTTLNVSLVKDTICYKDSVLLNFHITGKSAPYSISLNNGNAKDSLYYSPLYEPYVYDSLYIYPTDSFAYHNFTATITDAWNNTITKNLSVYVNSCYVGVAEQIKENSSIRIYPNPAHKILTIALSKAKGTATKIEAVEIYDIYGRKVSNVIANRVKQSNNITINISTLQKGIYFIKLRTEKEIVVKKIIKS